MTLLDLIKVKTKILGIGYTAIVYLGIDKNNKKFAIRYRKIKDINEYNLIKEKKYQPYKLISKLNKKYPNLFITLYDYKIVDNIKIDFEKLLEFRYSKEYMKEVIKNGRKLWNSPFTSIECYSLVDLTLSEIKLNKKIFYNCFIQLANIIYILKKNQLAHYDLHKSNIGLINVDNKFLSILNHKVNNYGYQIQLLDIEGFSFYKKYYNCYYNILFIDIISFKYRKNIIFSFEKFEKYYYDYIKNDFIDILYNKNFIIPKKYKLKLDQYLPEAPDEINEHLIKLLFKLLYAEKFQRLLLKDNFIKYIKFELNLPLATILFIIKNINYEKQILNYLLINCL